jgi:hypothetical protein
MRGTERWRRMRLGVATQRTAKAQGADRRAPSPNPLPAPGQGLIPRSPALPPPLGAPPAPPRQKRFKEAHGHASPMQMSTGADLCV